MAAPSIPDGLDELRDLLVDPERKAIAALRARLDDPVLRGRDLANGLPEALAHCSDDRRLTEALMPPVEAVITSSVRRNPRPLADALFPVIGPAIRKAIAHALSGMLDSLNRTLEQSVSVRALQWRVTAWRTGKSFGEIVLLNTLVYRVEQVFLIHAHTGLLLQHVVADAVTAQDADMVSGMLTAIRDFARDSFGGRAEDTLERFRVGELNCLIEHGPHAYLAVVVRGTPPHDLRLTLQRAIEAIHLQQTADLERFSGDASIFDDARPVLQECLESRFRGSDTPVSYRRWWIGAGAGGWRCSPVWGGAALRGPAPLRPLSGRARRAARPGRRQRRPPGRTLRRLGPARSAGGRSGVAYCRHRPAPRTASKDAGQLYQALDPRMAAAPRRGRAAAAARRDADDAERHAGGHRRSSDGLGARGVAAGADAARRARNSISRASRTRSCAAPAGGWKPRWCSLSAGTPDLVPGQDAGARQRWSPSCGSSTRPRARRGSASRRRHRPYRRRRPGRSQPHVEPRACRRGRGGDAAQRVAALEFESRGVGSAEPMAEGTTEADKQRNRRVAVRIHPLGASCPAMIQKKICMLGSFSVGKTSLVARFVSSVFSDKYLTTVGVKIDKKSRDGRRHRRDPDVVGHLRRRRLPEAADVLPARRLRLPAGRRWHATRHAGHRPAGAADRARAGGRDAVHPVPQQGRPARPVGDRSRPGRARARDEGWVVIETSAKLGAGVEEAFSQLTARMLSESDDLTRHGRDFAVGSVHRPGPGRDAARRRGRLLPARHRARTGFAASTRAGRASATSW